MTTGGGSGATLEAIVLAAGAGTRFGGGKLAAPWRGRPLLLWALDAAFTAPVRTVTVVTGADMRVEALASDHAETARSSAQLKLVHASEHAEGVAASLRAGLAGLPGDAAGVFLFLGDMPRVPAEIPALLAAALAGGGLAAAPVFGGRRGHPVLFSRALVPRLLALTGDAGARAILDGLGHDLVLAPAPDDGVLFDVDTPA